MTKYLVHTSKFGGEKYNLTTVSGSVGLQGIIKSSL